jgi:GH18 family chitinase
MLLKIGFANIDLFGTGTFAFQTSTQPGGGFDATKIASLRTNNPGMKVMASFGGWGLDRPYRGNASTDDTSTSATSGRTWFANQISSFVNHFELDGADLDWE